MELGVLSLLLVANAALFAPATAVVAYRRHRSPIAWFAFGLVIGPAAPALVWLSPPGRCAACDSPTVGWLARCVECGADARTGVTADSVAPTAMANTARRRSAAGARAAAPAARQARAPRESAARSRDMARPIAVGPGRRAGPGRRTAATPAGVAQAGALPTAARTPPAAVRGEAPEAGISTTRGSTGGGGFVAIATGVYAGGSVRLEIGHRYTIARDAADLVVMGPVETTPTAVAHRHELATIDPVGVDDRLVITGIGDGRGKYLLRFQAVAGMRPEDVEQRLGTKEAQTVGSGVKAGDAGG